MLTSKVQRFSLLRSREEPTRAASTLKSAALPVSLLPVLADVDGTTRAKLNSVVDDYIKCSSPAVPLNLRGGAEVDEAFTSLEPAYLSKLGYIISRGEALKVDATGGSSVYGEILPEGVAVLLDIMKLEDNSVFYDLGCGLGRAVLLVALNSEVARSCGVELSATRVEQAEEALNLLKAAGLPLRPVEFIHGDIATTQYNDGTHFYLCSTGFKSMLCRKIAERVSKLPNFKVLVTSRQLPNQPYLRRLGQVPCHYSWQYAAHCHVYVKSVTSAPINVLSSLCVQDGVAWLPQRLEQPDSNIAFCLEEPLTQQWHKNCIMLANSS